jgi:hypothetical protein
MATKTLSNVGEPEAVHIGVNAKICRISLSVTNSVGDIHIIGRMPHGAIPLEAIFYPATAIGQTLTKFGTSASNDLFFASDTYSVGEVYRNSRLLGSPKQISLSDDAMPRYENITFVATEGATVGHLGDLVVFYKMPGQTL